MKNIKKLFFLGLVLSNFLIFAQNSIIILYGCSSAGKTSISTELLRILPGNWKYIPSNRFRMTNGNNFFWKEINQQVADGYDVIVDTHSSQFLIDDVENRHVVVCLIYCSPAKLIEHVSHRNQEENKKNHRPLRGVFQEYLHKFKSVKSDQPYIDKINKDALQNTHGWSSRKALKVIISKFFTNAHQSVAYIAPKIQNYDCLIDTGKISIAQGAAKIKQKLMSQFEK